MGDPSDIFQLKQEYLRRENKNRSCDRDMKEKKGECEEDILPIGCWEDGLPNHEITTYSANRLAVSEEAADLKKYLKML